MMPGCYVVRVSVAISPVVCVSVPLTCVYRSMRKVSLDYGDRLAGLAAR